FPPGKPLYLPDCPDHAAGFFRTMRWDVIFSPARAIVIRSSSPPRARRTVFGRRWGLAVCIAAGLGWLALPCAHADPAPLNVRGLPFTRSYPLAEIGEAPRGARLSFDRFGRLAVVYSGFYAVLNDTVWLDLADKDPRNSIGMANVVHGPDGTAYYGALGSWGVVEFAADGKLRARPLMQTEAPKWALTTELSD